MKSIHKHIAEYIFDTTVRLQDRSFVLFSFLVLVALYAAVPFGLLMHEPFSATVSTLFCAIVFSLYVFYVFKKGRIEQAKLVLSVVVVVFFLPAMFFSNGGAPGGAPIWLLLGTIYIALILEGRIKVIMLVVNSVILVLCWIIGYRYPELVTEYTRGQNYFDTLSGLFIVGAIVYVIIMFCISLFRMEEKDKNRHLLFEQTAAALANAIDAKDKYTHGHSARVAEYSRKIAECCGKSPAECDEIYQIALLHDVGKIGIPENIINKEGKLTKEEYEVIKQHPVLGSQILKSINEYPDLIIGARYHHERYDGKGYPDRLKGEDIPEIARIISVADAYDAMTSKRSYRDPIPQQSVREEIVKGSGTQFDPGFARIMQHLIDLDTEYDMKEKSSIKELSGKAELCCKVCRDDISDGILVGPSPQKRRISFMCEALDRTKEEASPMMILFDSLDARYHDKPREIEELNYFEYATLRFDGQYECEGARKIAVSKTARPDAGTESRKNGARKYALEAVRVKDHLRFLIDNGKEEVTVTVALPDSIRYSYIGLTGDNCRIYDVDISMEDECVSEDYITRIAEEVSYINGPEGDLPNLQVNGYRTGATEGISVKDGMKIIFHTMSLPTARLIWHTAYIDLFSSGDKMPFGAGYREYALIRLDGEYWEAEGAAENRMIVNKSEEFQGWDSWKAVNKEGFDCTVSFKKEGNKIITTTENLGISLNVITTVLEEADEVYVSLTGDQCALTNIRIVS